MVYRALAFAIILLAIVWITRGDPEIIANLNVRPFTKATEPGPAQPTSLSPSLPEPTAGGGQSSTSRRPPLPANLHLQSALVKYLGSPSALLGLNTSQRWPIASLTKLLTAAVALENIKPSPNVTDLIKLMIFTSQNEAAEKLANLYQCQTPCLSPREEFIRLMQAKAQALAMTDTIILDPAGLSFINQSTVQDLEKLVIYLAKRHPQIFQLTREEKIVVNGREFTNPNKFAGQANFMGGKTGYTDEASGNIISIFEHQGQPLLIIALGAANKVERSTQTKILFEWTTRFSK